MDQITKFDFKILDYIQKDLTNEFLDKVMPVITSLCDRGALPIVLAVILLIFSRTRRIGLSMSITYICGFIIGNLCLKNIVARIRPYDVNQAVTLLVKPLSDYSFPSGHTLIAVECAAVLIFSLTGKDRIYSFIAAGFSCLIGFSRLYLYVHYPSDVIASVLLGAILGYFCVKLTEYLFKKLPNNKSDTTKTESENG